MKFVYCLVFIATLAVFLWLQTDQKKSATIQSQPIPTTTAELLSATDNQLSEYRIPQPKPTKQQTFSNTPTKPTPCTEECLEKYIGKMKTGEEILPKEMHQLLSNRNHLIEYLSTKPDAIEAIALTATITENQSLKSSIEFLLKILPPAQLTHLASNLTYASDVNTRRSAIKLLAEAYRDEIAFDYIEDEIESASEQHEPPWQKSKTGAVIKTLLHRETDPENKILAIEIFATKSPDQINEEMLETLSDLADANSPPKIRGLALKILSSTIDLTPEHARDISNALSTDIAILQTYSLSAIEQTLIRTDVDALQNNHIRNLYKNSLEEILSNTETKPTIAIEAKRLLDSYY